MPARSTASSNAELVWVFREFQYSGKQIVKPPKREMYPQKLTTLKQSSYAGLRVLSYAPNSN